MPIATEMTDREVVGGIRLAQGWLPMDLFPCEHMYTITSLKIPLVCWVGYFTQCTIILS